MAEIALKQIYDASVTLLRIKKEIFSLLDFVRINVIIIFFFLRLLYLEK